MQLPCWHICEGMQDIPQAPQFVRSVLISVQLAPHTRRSEGQTITFVGVGLARGDCVILVISVVITRIGVVVSGRGVSIITYDVTVGVCGVVTAATAEGKILSVPDACRKYSAARIMIIATMAMAIILSALFWPDGAVGDT